MKSTASSTRSKATKSEKNGSHHVTTDSELRDSAADSPSKAAPAEKVKEGCREMAEDAKAKLNESAHSIVESARVKIDQTKARASDLAETSKQTAEQKYEQYVATVREKPMGAVGIAAAIGFVVGAALGTMLSKRS